MRSIPATKHSTQVTTAGKNQAAPSTCSGIHQINTAFTDSRRWCEVWPWPARPSRTMVLAPPPDGPHRRLVAGLYVQLMSVRFHPHKDQPVHHLRGCEGVRLAGDISVMTGRAGKSPSRSPRWGSCRDDWAGVYLPDAPMPWFLGNRAWFLHATIVCKVAMVGAACAGWAARSVPGPHVQRVLQWGSDHIAAAPRANVVGIASGAAELCLPTVAVGWGEKRWCLRGLEACLSTRHQPH